MSSLFHVAFLYLEPYEAMKAGTKRIEYRERRRPDRTIERLQPGTPIVFRLAGLTRGSAPSGPALLVTCRRVTRSWRPRDDDRPYLYRVHIADVCEITCTGSIQQGWRQRTAHWTRERDHLLGAELRLW